MKYHLLGGKWTSTKSQLTEENSVDETDHGPMAADFQVLDDVFRRHFRRKLAALPQLCSTAVEGALQLVQEERDGKASGRRVLKKKDFDMVLSYLEAFKHQPWRFDVALHGFKKQSNFSRFNRQFGDNPWDGNVNYLNAKIRRTARDCHGSVQDFDPWTSQMSRNQQVCQLSRRGLETSCGKSGHRPTALQVADWDVAEPVVLQGLWVQVLWEDHGVLPQGQPRLQLGKCSNCMFDSQNSQQLVRFCK